MIRMLFHMRRSTWLGVIVTLCLNSCQIEAGQRRHLKEIETAKLIIHANKTCLNQISEYFQKEKIGAMSSSEDSEYSENDKIWMLLLDVNQRSGHHLLLRRVWPQDTVAIAQVKYNSIDDNMLHLLNWNVIANEKQLEKKNLVKGNADVERPSYSTLPCHIPVVEENFNRMYWNQTDEVDRHNIVRRGISLDSGNQSSLAANTSMVSSTEGSTFATMSDFPTPQPLISTFVADRESIQSSSSDSASSLSWSATTLVFRQSTAKNTAIVIASTGEGISTETMSSLVTSSTMGVESSLSHMSSMILLAASTPVLPGMTEVPSTAQHIPTSWSSSTSTMYLSTSQSTVSSTKVIVQPLTSSISKMAESSQVIDSSKIDSYHRSTHILSVSITLASLSYQKSQIKSTVAVMETTPTVLEPSNPSTSLITSSSTSTPVVDSGGSAADKKEVKMIMYITIGSVVGFIILIIIIIMAVGCRKGSSQQASFNVTTKTDYELGNFHSLPRASVKMYGDTTDVDGRPLAAYDDPINGKNEYAQGLPDWHHHSTPKGEAKTNDSFQKQNGDDNNSIRNAYDNPGVNDD